MSGLGLTKDSIPSLPTGVRVKHDEVRGRTILMAPERTLALDGTSIAIIELVDGDRSIIDIVAELGEKYNAPEQEIGNDVVAFLRDLINRGYLDIRNAG